MRLRQPEPWREIFCTAVVAAAAGVVVTTAAAGAGVAAVEAMMKAEVVVVDAMTCCLWKSANEVLSDDRTSLTSGQSLPSVFVGDVAVFLSEFWDAGRSAVCSDRRFTSELAWLQCVCVCCGWMY